MCGLAVVLSCLWRLVVLFVLCMALFSKCLVGQMKCGDGDDGSADAAGAAVMYMYTVCCEMC